MSKYATTTALTNFLKGYNISGTIYTSDDHEIALAAGDEWVDAYCERQFQFRKWNEVHDGNGAWSIMAREYPVFIVNEIVVRYYPLSVVRTFRETDAFLLINKQMGKISIRPSFALVGSFPPDYAQYYAYIFPRGESNINVNLTLAYAVIGDNIGITRVSESYHNEVATVEVVGADVLFRTPKAYGGWGAVGTISAVLPKSVKMLKTLIGQAIDTFTDDSANWTIVDSFTLKIATTNYTADAMYRFVYIPQAVSASAIRMAASTLLSQKGGREDQEGAGGARSISISGLSESYGDEGPFSGQFSIWKAQAESMLRIYRRQPIAIPR